MSRNIARPVRLYEVKSWSGDKRLLGSFSSGSWDEVSCSRSGEQQKMINSLEPIVHQIYFRIVCRLISRNSPELRNISPSIRLKGGEIAFALCEVPKGCSNTLVTVVTVLDRVHLAELSSFYYKAIRVTIL